MTGTSSRPLENQATAPKPRSQIKQTSTDSAKSGPSVFPQQPKISMPLTDSLGYTENSTSGESSCLRSYVTAII